MGRKKQTLKYDVRNAAPAPNFSLLEGVNDYGGELWRWGDDNNLPLRLERLARANAIHRGIINSKSNYIAGKGFICDDKNAALLDIVERANGTQSLAEVVRGIIYDRALFGNYFIEIAVCKGRPLFFHQDASRCRVSKPDNEGLQSVIISKDWANHNKSYDKSLPLYPRFVKDESGVMRSIYHSFDYEPTFEHYGVPTYVAGLTSARIGSKTGNWNEDRLDNSFQPSGVMELVDENATGEELEKLTQDLQSKYAGKPGQVMFMAGNSAGSSKFTPIQSNNEGDWLNLHTVSKNDMVTAHSWFISLAGLDYSTGISADRILSEYSVALSTVIEPEQARILGVLRGILGILGVDAETLEFVNKAPILAKPQYMRVWEARKADGLDFDENDPAQQIYLAQITAKQQSNG